VANEAAALALSVLGGREFIIFGDKNAFFVSLAIQFSDPRFELEDIAKLCLLMVAKRHAPFDLQFIRRSPIS